MQEPCNPSVKEIAAFLAEYAALLMGSGVHTSRVIRNSKRIAESFDVTLKASIFHRNIILTVKKNVSDEIYVEVIDIPVLPINFEYNSELSSLSWEAYDKRLPLPVLWEKYNRIVSSPRLNSLFVLLMVGFANASFCQLFGGDLISTIIVFLATLVGFSLRTTMQKRHVNHYIVFIVSAFAASACASTSVLFETTSEIALTTSVLFLIPGVPLINGAIDILEGYILTGFARLTNALLLVICIAIGLSFTLWMIKDSLI